eukprot:m.188939 g.188939  ORF g.188939 m.188939 type:complete len:2143 (-) comp16735_c0_seq1:1771-8199(-)
MADQDFSGLPLAERLTHKVWKARLSAYEELTKTFQRSAGDEDTLAPWKSKLAGCVADTNAAAQLQGIELALAWLDNAPKRLVPSSDIANAITSKCLNPSKTQTKEKVNDLCLLLVEVGEQPDAVIEALMGGFTAKQPKAAAHAVNLVNAVLSAFGAKIVNPKPFLKKTVGLLSHVNKDVREEAKSLINEIHRWLGDAIKPSLADVKPVQMKELEEEWANAPSSKPKPTHNLRSQAKKAAAANDTDQDGGKQDEATELGDSEVADDEDQGVDAYELADPVNGLANIPKTFESELEESKWSVRRDALQAAYNALNTVKLADGDYGDLIRLLKRVIANDSNVINVALATDCIGAIAFGLRDRFSSYSNLVCEVMLDKFKEKKLNVVTALHKAIQPVLENMNTDKAFEALAASLKQKNPMQVQHTATVLSTALPRISKKQLSKAHVSTVAPVLVDCLKAREPEVREAGTTALCALIKCAGEKLVMPYLSDVDKKKQDKILEDAKASGKTTATGSTKTSKPTSSAASRKQSTATTASSQSSKPATATSSSTTSSSATTKSKPKRTKSGLPSSAIATSTKKSTASAGKKSTAIADSAAPVSFPEMSLETAEGHVKGCLSSETYQQLESSAWKEKLEGSKGMLSYVDQQEEVDASLALAFFVVIQNRTRQWKETNFQVMGSYFEVMSALASKASPSCPDRCVDMAMAPLVDKLGDMKLKSAASDALMSFCEQIGPNFVVLRMCSLAKAQKSPKVHTETCNVIAEILKAFGMQLSVKSVVAFAREMLASTNAGVRTAAIELLGTLRLFVGPSLSSLFQDEKPALLQLINEKFEAVSGEKAPAATRFVAGAKKASRASSNDDGEDDNNGTSSQSGSSSLPNKKGKKQVEEEDAADDLIPRENLGDHVPADLIANLDDKSWKVRNEALEQLGDVLKRHPRLKPEVGDVLQVLKRRLSDSNKNLVIIALNHLNAIGVALGRKGCRHNLSQVLSDVLNNLADNKDAVRAAVIDTLSAWTDQAGIAAVIETEAVPACLASGKPNAQSGILAWLSERLTPLDTDDLPQLKGLVKPVMQCLQDRNSGVRKAAQQLVPDLARSIGVDRMRKLAGTLPSTSKDVVIGLLDKIPTTTTPNAPSASKKQDTAASESDDGKVSAVKTTKAGSKKPSSAALAKTEPTGKSAQPSSTSSNDTGAGSDQPLTMDNRKQQRIKDDKAHKSLKWNFTTPREEYVQQLQSSLKAAVSKQLYSQMFSDDFREHCKAIDTLSKAVTKQAGESAPQADEAIAILDLLLMWVTLRFFETNPKTQLKAMTFLKTLFEAVADQSYALSEYEASSFIPYLIQKLGDKMENIRDDTHAVLALMIRSYPGSKMFTYLLDGLKSKNSRQRAGCLVAMNNLLASQGMAVCEQVGAPKALKTVTKQVADRDHPVRSAALDFIVTAHEIQGDGIYKLMGTVPDKSMSLITERVKRASKSAKPQNAAPTASLQAEPTVQVNRSLSSSLRGSATKIPSVAQEFSLDLDSLNLPAVPTMKMPELAPTVAEDDAMTGAVVVPVQQVAVPVSQQQLQQPVITPAATLPTTTTVTLEDIIDHISSTDIRQAIHALKLAEDLVKEKDIKMLSSVGSLVTACTLQLRLVFTVHSVRDQDLFSPGKRPEAVRLCKHVLSCIMHVYEGRAFARSVPDHVQQQLLVELVSRLLDEKVEQWQDGAHISRALNMILLRILENSRRDVTFSVLIRVLNDACAEKMVVPLRFTELIMKCLWKLTKSLNEYLSEINVDHLLREIHEFLVAHPPVEWKKRTNDTPLRTMKTILNSLVKAMGSSVMSHLSLVGQSPLDTAVGSYIVLMLKRDGHSDEELKKLLPESALHAPTAPVSSIPVVATETSTSTISSLSARLARAKSKLAAHDTEGGTNPYDDTSNSATFETRPEYGEENAGVQMRNSPRPLRAVPHRYDSVAEFVEMEAQTQARSGVLEAIREKHMGSASTQDTRGLSAEEAAQQIHEILERVTSKETTRQGLQELKAFKEQHPTLDVMAHCQHLSSYMQSYIKRRMEEVDVVSSLPTAVSSTSNTMTYWERLRALQSKVTTTESAALNESVSAPAPIIAPAPMEDVKLPEVAPIDTRLPLQRKDNEQADASQQRSLATLKARLAKLKHAQSA